MKKPVIEFVDFSFQYRAQAKPTLKNINFINEGQLWWQGSNQNILETDNQELKDFIFCSALTKKLQKN